MQNREDGIAQAYFPTDVSTSASRKIAKHRFAQGSGMLVEMGENVSNGKGKAKCCHIHWLSEFPRETEVLFSRCGDFCWQLREKEGESTQMLQVFKLDKAFVDMSIDEDGIYPETDDSDSSTSSDSGSDE